MKTKVVIFTANNARILINPNNISHYKNRSNVVINPDLSAVEGISPHLWTLKEGKIVPLESNEKQLRLEDIENRGTINDIESIIKPERPKLRNRTKFLLALLLGASLGFLLKFIL